MKRTTRFVGIAGLLVAALLLVASPLYASAFWSGFPFGNGLSSPSEHGSSFINFDKFPAKLCAKTIKTGWLSVPVFLPGNCEPTPPPPVDVCPNVPGTQTSGPCADEECVEDGGTWDGDSCEFPPPPEPTLIFNANPTVIQSGSPSTLTWDSSNAMSCTASNGWTGTKPLDGSEIVSPSATTTYQLECVGEGGTTTQSVVIDVAPVPPPPPEGKFLITEVLYDLTTSTTSPQGDEPSNEWVELHNGTNADINLSNYSIADASSTDVLPDVMLPAGKYAVITASSTTASFWSIPGDAVIVILGSSIGSGGLGNDGDMVALIQNAGTTTIDAVSWGSNTSAFSPSVPDVGTNLGHSIAREPVTADTGTNADWVDRSTPTPGQ